MQIPFGSLKKLGKQFWRHIILFCNLFAEDGQQTDPLYMNAGVSHEEQLSFKEKLQFKQPVKQY
jgi:hypothetical protein